MTDEIKQSKIDHAVEWVRTALTANGPEPGCSAVVVVTLDPVDGEPDKLYVNCRALPDIQPLAFASALEDLAKGIRENNVEWTPRDDEKVTH